MFHTLVYRPEYISAMVKSSLHLCAKLSKKLRSIEENRVKLLRSAFSCALCAIENLYKGGGDKTDRDKAVESIRELLKDWIAHREVIGGSVFGHSVQSYFTRSHASWKGKEELKVCRNHYS